MGINVHVTCFLNYNVLLVRGILGEFLIIFFVYYIYIYIIILINTILNNLLNDNEKVIR